MKKIIFTIIASLSIPFIAFAFTTFYSGQVGGSASNGYVLQTDGTNSTWVSTSTLGIISSTNYFSNSGATTTLTTGTILAAPTGTFDTLNATSTTATSTFANGIILNNPNFGFYVGSSSPPANIYNFISGPASPATGSTLLAVRQNGAASGGSIFTAYTNAGVGLRIDSTGVATLSTTQKWTSGGGDANIILGGGIGSNTFSSQANLTNIGNDFLFNNSGNRTVGNIFQIQSSSTPVFTIPYTNYVGIGTTSPSNELEVSGNTFLGGNLTATGTLKVSYLTYDGSLLTLANSGTFRSTGTGSLVTPIYALGSSNNGWYDPADPSIAADIGGSEVMRITSGLVSTNGVASSTSSQVNGNSTTTGNVVIGGQITSYNGVSDLDVPIVVAKASVVASTTVGTILTFTPPTDGYYQIQIFLNVTAISTDTIRYAEHFTDIDGTAWYFVGSTLSTVSGTTGILFMPLQGGTPATFTSELVAAGGSVTYNERMVLTRLTNK